MNKMTEKFQSIVEKVFVTSVLRKKIPYGINLTKYKKELNN
jgi:hypothetical protein